MINRKDNYIKIINNLVNNSSIELKEDIDQDNIKGRKFVSRFIEAGIVNYADLGNVLITKETLNKFIDSMIGCPVVIQHKDITAENVDKERAGVISGVYFNEADGWFYCEGIIWDAAAVDLVKNQGWSVSCTYEFESDFTKRKYNDIDIDMEFTGGKFLYLALVDNPRYTGANIVINSKDFDEKKHPGKERVDNEGDQVLIDIEDKSSKVGGLSNLDTNSIVIIANSKDNFNPENKKDDILTVINSEDFDESKINRDERGRFAKKGQGEYQHTITVSQNKIDNLNTRRKELDLNRKSTFDRIEEFEKKSKKENSKYWNWQDKADSYISDYADFLADYCNQKGYITEVEKSNQSISTYVKLFETEEQKEENAPVYEIRISDHENGYGDKDVMLHYSASIDEALNAIDNTINNIISEEFKKNFKGVILDENSISPELNFKNLEVPERQKKIKKYYKKYFQTSNENENTKHLYKDGIGQLFFSKKLLNKLTTRKDFAIVQIFLSNIEEIIDKGIVKDISENEKEIITSLIKNNSIFDFVLSAKKDSRGNYIVDITKEISRANGKHTTATADNNIIANSKNNVNPNSVFDYELFINKDNKGNRAVDASKINAGQDTKGDNPQTLTDNNIIANSKDNFNPENKKDDILTVINSEDFDESKINRDERGRFAKKGTQNFNSFEEFQEAFKDYIEEAPKDYETNNLEEALKDLGITEDKPRKIKNPYETVEVRAGNIKHIIDREDDKTRYKSINKMFATIERPNIITICENNERRYFKIFQQENKNLRQITFVSTDTEGNFILTTLPAKRQSWFLKKLNEGNVIYERRKGVINSPVNNIIANSKDNVNPNNTKDNKKVNNTTKRKDKIVMAVLDDLKAYIKNIVDNECGKDKKDFEEEDEKEIKKEKEETKEETKEEADNKKAKNEAGEEDKKEDKKEVDNSSGITNKVLEMVMGGGVMQPAAQYISRAERLKLGDNY